ncbi:bifunctional hydroxymethylpyrimidine kinase/phosphomethylpyrimidine kinase [Primorskyibacter sp. 2E107]|uniref:bifunctional hydroxymethylpyrimidine kinase/phosphomethylpyrimidine kinase n=1 Tax=Primorskyibacter sp. 2E107 TaxID=3403458 RepID=UPI003AF70630
MRTILTIGGTDSSGGAGLSRDAFVARAMGFDVQPIVTAVTAQSHAGVFAVEVMPPDLVRAQISAALEAQAPSAVKIGMLGSGAIAAAVAVALADLRAPVVLDPVLRSSSGGTLMAGALPCALLALSRVITPNLPEAAALSGGGAARGDAQIARQANWFLARGAQAVLIKGGHACGARASDHLFDPGGAGRQVFHAARLGVQRRGTGCALATAIACGLADTDCLSVACQAAKGFVQRWLREGVAGAAG